MKWPPRLRKSPPASDTPAADVEAAVRQAAKPLRLLLAAAIILPILVFAGASWIAYGHTIEEVRGRLARTLSGVAEHAAKVFETFELSARYVDEYMLGVPDETIRADEAEYNARLRAMVDSLPQLRDIWIVGADGQALVSGTVFPMPRKLDLSDREYFAVQKNSTENKPYITEVLDARAANLRFFSMSRKRAELTDGTFTGVIVVSAAPEYFSEYYSRLSTQSGTAIGLVRRDGAILAWHPQLPWNNLRIHPESRLLHAIQNSAGGMVTSVSPVDGVERMFAYRKIPNYDLFVIAGVQTAAISEEWLSTMAKHLIFGVPATLALIVLSLMALQRTRREALAHARLREEVARRESAEHALRQAQKMEAIGRLTGGIAHDFNNLLTAILGNVDLALQKFGSNDGRLHRYLSSARDASNRAATLVTRLLAFSRQHPLEVSVIDINRLVRGMSDLLQRTIGETITIETVLAGGLWKTAVDANQLESAILNLAVNARDAMPNGGRLTIETANAHLDESYGAVRTDEIPAGQYVMVAITDTGVGMSRDVIDHAFEPFFTTKPPGAGTGLGLSMVYGFVKQSGGHVRIYSEKGEGTTVRLYFPRSFAAEISPTADIQPKPENAPAPQPNEVVLLVEDDEEVNRFATEILSDIGYRVHSANNGASALKTLAALDRVDLLFTDVVLPGGMNGRELAREAQNARPALKVLYATGYTKNAIIHQGRLDPDVELLSKPFTAQDLARKVRQVLDSGSASDRAEQPTSAL